MRHMRIAGLVVLICASLSIATSAGEIKLDLTGAGTGTFSGVGSNITYTDTIQVRNSQTGDYDDYDLTLTLSGSSTVTVNASGIGVSDASIENGESLSMNVHLAPSVGTTSSLNSFQFTDIEHGTTVSNFPTSFVLASDGNASTLFAHNHSGETSVANLDGRTLHLSTSTTPFSPGSIEGITSLSFEVTSAPEPSSLALCGVLFALAIFRRKRRGASVTE